MAVQIVADHFQNSFYWNVKNGLGQYTNNPNGCSWFRIKKKNSDICQCTGIETSFVTGLDLGLPPN